MFPQDGSVKVSKAPFFFLPNTQNIKCSWRPRYQKNHYDDNNKNIYNNNNNKRNNNTAAVRL